MQQEGIPKFARADQVLYEYKGKVVITSYLGETHRSLIAEPGKMDWFNYPAADLYLQAVDGILTNKRVSGKHVLLNVHEDLKQRLMLTNAQADAMDREETLKWYKENSYCVHVADETGNDTMYGMMVWHMNQFFRDELGIEVTYEVTEDARCLALVRNRKNEAIGNSLVEELKSGLVGVINGKVSDFIYFLNNYKGNYLDCPIIDETSYVANVDLRITPDFSNVFEINKELELYNLKLVEALRPIGMLVIRSAI